MAGLSFVVLIPKSQEIFSLRGSLTEKEETLKKLEEKKTILASIDAVSVVKNIKEVKSALPGEKDAASILITLENISNTTGFSIDSITLSPGSVSTGSAKPKIKSAPSDVDVVSRKGNSSLAVNVKSRGTTAQLSGFLKTLGSSRRLFDIGSVDITYSTDEPDFLSASFSLFAYFLPEINSIGAVDAPVARISAAEQQVIDTVVKFPDYSTISIDSSQVSQSPLGKSDLFTQ